MDTRTHTIGRAAALAGVGIDTVRYYERAGLLAPAERTATGYRRYGEDELRRHSSGVRSGWASACQRSRTCWP